MANVVSISHCPADIRSLTGLALTATAAAVLTRGGVLEPLAFCAAWACAVGNWGTAGMDDLRRCSLSVPGRAPGPRALIASPSDARLARTLPASFRWNQLMIGLLDLRVIFFIWDCVVASSGCFGGVGVVSFFDFTVGFDTLRLRLDAVSAAPLCVGG